MKVTDMKKLLLMVVMMAGLAMTASAADITIQGEATCAKCTLKLTDACQNAIKVTNGDKTMIYFLAKNPVSDQFHEKVCKTSLKVVATGAVKREGDKLVMTATSIKAVE